MSDGSDNHAADTSLVVENVELAELAVTVRSKVVVEAGTGKDTDSACCSIGNLFYLCLPYFLSCFLLILDPDSEFAYLGSS